MSKRFINFITKNNIIHPGQYGFLQGRSTEHAMLEITYRIMNAIENKKLTLGIFLDLSKAFDTISHPILLNKLHKYGIRGIALGWFRSYLTKRLQYIDICSNCSSFLPIAAGVP